MTDELAVRKAELDDVSQITHFGRAHVARHYTPILGAAAAAGQVRQWWTDAAMTTATAAGLVVVAETLGKVVGVAELGRWEGAPVVWKLYVHPDHRGAGLGPRLLAAVEELVDDDDERLLLEHFAGNVRAAAFYEREGFTVDRVEPAPSGRREHDVVWRSRPLRRRG
ncbi:Acetyltransferase (GNAT) family protein [Quadrisphaera granulorum]|uniref:Acetyltransferase (GNAT) family protein n=1 Tax=Quadrisphaera granulorum TaxID=317664 RepID=A0A315ZZW4_9ACTN|nr:GNAT family N-acetyltransferase [Quadrisphaera granulorum]PWJ51131.1 acetyltransferase (GNAT) family protein [Quadrisphaera granulorum]SZE97781.1 Acetyltransferase (GNAT) family protein [Quadrisphaera granulorum]